MTSNFGVREGGWGAQTCQGEEGGDSQRLRAGAHLASQGTHKDNMRREHASSEVLKIMAWSLSRSWWSKGFEKGCLSYLSVQKKRTAYRVAPLATCLCRGGIYTLHIDA